jgi:transcriptional regulator with GAF, ATPase, and Fis domain
MRGDHTVTPTPPPLGGERAVHELRVVFSVDEYTPASVVLPQAAVSVGRNPPGRDAIHLADRRVSRVHVIVEPAGDGWVARDQGSHNGTWVDGARAPSTPLAPGSVIRVGSSLLLLIERGAAVGDDGVGSELLGGSAAIRRVRAEARLAAGQRLTTLVTGETGVGKERVAREVHRLSGRGGPFVALNCAAVSPALAESELFGHVAGSFTGAVRRSSGVFDAAHGGTLLLDEIGEMPLDLQPKLLRALAVGEIRPVGAAEAHAVDVRVVCATNRDLDVELRAGRFRADLLSRIAGWRIAVPALRARREDILPLAEAILDGRAALSADAAEALLLHDWPFNVRELEQTLAAAALRAADAASRTITTAHLPEVLAGRLAGRTAGGDRVPSAGAVADVDAAPDAHELAQVLDRCGGNVSAVARHYGKERRQIYRWMARHGLDAERKARP